MKRISSFLLILALVLSISTTAFASGTTSDKGEIKDVFTGASAAFDTSNPDIINVTFTSDSLVDGGQYLVLMVKATLDANGTATTTPEITEKSILYIDQTTASGNQITFKVYPSSIQDSVILIAGVGVNGEAGPVIAAIVDAAFILGDVTNDGKVNSQDTVMLNRHLAKLRELEGAMLSAADINHDGKINSQDAVKLNRYLAKIIAALD